MWQNFTFLFHYISISTQIFHTGRKIFSHFEFAVKNFRVCAKK